MKKELWFGLILMAIIIISTVIFMPAPSQWTKGHLGLLMLSLIVVAIMLGFPTAFTLMGMGVFFTWLAFDYNTGKTLDLMVQRAYAVMTNDVLISIPLFVFMGYLVERANLIEKLFKSLHLSLSRIPGALAVATLVTCAIFATATGIVGAVVTLMGLLAFPAMLRAGYNIKVSAGVITAGGCLGILIPPSVMLIVYGATAGVSVVKLYAGAFFPGIMLAGLYIGYVMILAKIKPESAPPLSEKERQVDLPGFAKQISQVISNKAIPGLLRAIKGEKNVNVPIKTLLLQFVIALLPALIFAAVLGTTYYVATQPDEVVNTEGLIEMTADSDDSTEKAPAAPSTVEKAPAEKPAAAKTPARLPTPLWFWILFGVSTIVLLAFYGMFTFARLEIFKMLLGSFFPLALLILAVLGSIVFGWATPTEAAAIGSLGGFLLAWAYRQLNFGIVKESVFLTAKTSAMVCWLFVGSSIFSAAFALLGGQEIIEKWVLSLNMTPVQFMLLSQFIIFVLGWPLEWTEIIVIFMPIFIPLLAHFNIDPLFFGLLVALNLQTAFLSPPVAMAAFYLKGVAPPHVTLNQIFAGMMPFMAIQLIALALLYIFPGIGMWLPNVVYK